MKKAIIVVSFGSSYQEAREKAIEPIEDKIRSTYLDYHVARAFTSFIIIKKLKERDQIYIDTPKEAMENLIAEGYTEIILQPLHILKGFEYEKISQMVLEQRQNNPKVKITLGEPLLYHESDYEEVIKAVEEQLPALNDDQVLLFVGHGTDHEANTTYRLLEDAWKKKGYPAIVGTIEEGVDEVIPILDKLNKTNLLIVPFFIVAGDHVKNDLFGEEEDAWHHVLKKKGYHVKAYSKGLGENPAISEIYCRRIQHLI